MKKEMDAISWLRRNHKYIDHDKLPVEESHALEHLLTVSGPAYDVFMGRRLLFLLAVDVPPPLASSPMTIANYVTRALKHYVKYDETKPFDGVPARPGFLVENLPVGDMDMIKEVVGLIKRIKDFSLRYFNKIDGDDYQE